MAEQSATPATKGFITRTPPVFDNLDDERQHRIERLAGACRIFGKAGFSQSLLGHITVRDPENPEHFWANPIGVSFNRMRVSDIVLVDHLGQLIKGTKPVNPVGVLLHSAIHRAYPEITAVCHAHSVFGSAWSAFSRPIDPVTQDTAIFFEDQAIMREPRVAMDPAAADQFAAGLQDKRTGIQPGHGLFTTGATLDEAAWRFISMDRACQVQLLVEAAGTPELWPVEMARGLKQSLGSAAFCWLSFQTLWDELIDDGSDFLD